MAFINRMPEVNLSPGDRWLSPQEVEMARARKQRRLRRSPFPGVGFGGPDDGRPVVDHALYNEQIGDDPRGYTYGYWNNPGFGGRNGGRPVGVPPFGGPDDGRPWQRDRFSFVGPAGNTRGRFDPRTGTLDWRGRQYGVEDIDELDEYMQNARGGFRSYGHFARLHPAIARALGGRRGTPVTDQQPNVDMLKEAILRAARPRRRRPY